MTDHGMEGDARRIRVRAERLADFAGRIFQRVGVPPEDARIAADVLVAADLRGIESHGVARLRRLYVDRLRAGAAAPRPEVRVLRETPATALMDGGNGLGPPIAHRAMASAIEKAIHAGAGFVSVRNSNHFGIAGYYAMMALDRGCIGLCMTTANRWVVPTFGREAMLGTNPIAVAVPADREIPFVLDMATSIVSIGKLEVRDRLGQPIPAGWAADALGAPTTDPGPVLRGVPASAAGGLLPVGGAGEELGGHKGYGLAAWVEIFCALLSGVAQAGQAYHTVPDAAPQPAQVAHFFGAWRVEAFQPPDAFRAAMDGFLRALKASRKAEGHSRIYVAGEKEHEEAERRRRDGIPLPALVAADLEALGAEVGIPLAAGELCG
jgi:LDH2 family malate/lactate/ureidoglycolate dehydrogenase